MRLPENVTLVAASKYATVAQIREAYSRGIRIFGESRVKDAEKKIRACVDLDVHWHMIGHLQSNKAKLAVQLFDMVQSIDSPRLADKLDSELKNINKTMDILLQVNIGLEESKHGIPPGDLFGVIENIKRFKNLNLRGLMAIPPIADEQKTRDYFKKMKQLFDRTQLEILSMGMSDDYRIAIEEGANMVRLGRMLFSQTRS